MEQIIFQIFIFCMFIIFGVLILYFLNWIWKYFKICFDHKSWMIRILMIFPLSILLSIPCFIIYIFTIKGYIELLIAILIGCIGSYYIFKDDENI